MKGYWFSKADKRLRYGNGKLAGIGITHIVYGKPKLCERGLHGSRRLMDALKYAPGSILWLCEFDGDIVEGNDKFVARSRKYLAEYNATELLREFSRKCALRVIHLVEPYFKTQEDYELVVEFLKTGENAAPAYAAADEACTAAVVSFTTRGDTAAAIYSTAYVVADAVRAADYATVSTVVSIASNATYAVDDRVKEHDWQNETLTQMVREATGWEI